MKGLNKKDDYIILQEFREDYKKHWIKFIKEKKYNAYIIKEVA